MINKSIDLISEKDFKALKDSLISESKTLEYKRELSLNPESNKQEFLADISSFANASGGDLIVGMVADAGLPISIDGIKIDNVDQEISRIENIIRDGIQPRIVGINIKPVPLTNSNVVFLIRVPKSWNSPHRVIFKGHDKFYSRNSNGKYPMDVTELRIAFNLSETITEKVRNFNIDRISKIIANETPVLLYDNAKISLLLIPLISFNLAQSIDISKLSTMNPKPAPMYCSGWNERYNLDGLLEFSSVYEGKSHSYVQIYRNGIIEAVEALLLESNGEKKLIPSITYERELIQSTNEYLRIMKSLNIEPPILIFLNLLGVKGFVMNVEKGYISEHGGAIDRDHLLLQEIITENYNVNAQTLLRPAFDSVWNATGFSKSFNYDSRGEWVGYR